MKNLKERIVDASIDLFNREGAGRITTNHIIDELHISPGTLYYHFRNKEDIIRSIFKRITADFDEIFSIEVTGMAPGDAVRMVRRVYELYHRYRFFYIDLAAILRNDETLRRDYISNYRLKMKKYRVLFERSVDNGLFRKFSSEEEMEYLLRSLWIINDFWLSYCYAACTEFPDNIIDEGVKQHFYLLRPYLSEKTIEDLDI